MNRRAQAPFGDRYPATMPSTVEDLSAWEPAATDTFLAVPLPTMEWAIQRSMPVFGAVTGHLLVHRRGVETLRVGAGEPLPVGAVANILLLRGVTHLDNLWHLGNTLQPGSTAPAETLRRHRAGYTRALLRRLDGVDLPWHLAQSWEQTFSIPDLLLVLEAGLSGREVRDILDTGVLPDRDALVMMRALLHRDAEPALQP